MGMKKLKAWFKRQMAPRPGFTIGETALVVVAGAALMMGGFFIYNQAMEMFSTISSNRELAVMVAEIKGGFSGVSDYSALTVPLAVDNGLVPDNLVKGNGSDVTLINRWGGTIEIEPTDGANGVTDTAFAIKFEGVPKRACNKMIGHDPSAWLSVTVDGASSSETLAENPIGYAHDVCAADLNDITFVAR